MTLTTLATIFQWEHYQEINENAMTESSIFEDEWRECLRAQYMHVIRHNDTVTEKSLTTVLHEVGFTENELRELRVRATMHIDDVADDFVPDFESVTPADEVADQAVVHLGVDVEDDTLSAETDEAQVVEEADVTEQVDVADEVDDLPDESDVDEDDGQLSLF